ncbi:MAG: TRAP-type C4-dicarboxylate transport system, periplasmic component [Deltaproteobacteria bacterium]|jgi:TRAP-type C4-dicarboxylate transport system substrate-binding protein|nr:TRAP-type C4-dicarboxylate transport system, periplasmic component [Deltaproteobacteria bacterium]MBP1739096.1 TRAP-type C4-dicarboxylate transport system, periplasmic component [Deltaproteobacteria bacterium]
MKRGWAICFVVCFFLIAFLLPSGPLHAQEKGVKLRYSNFFPPMHPISKLSDDWGKEIDKRTNGRVKVTYFPGATLTPPMQTYDSTVKGIADVGQAVMAYAPGRLPLSEVLNQPLGVSSGIQATKLANAYYKKFAPKEFDDVKVMYLHGGAPCFFHTKNVISSIDGLKGLRIKCNAENAGIVTSLGAAPVTIPVTETYDGLQKGLLEGLLIAPEALKFFRFAEVVKTTLENYASSFMVSFFIVMNKDKWNSISKEDQQAIEKINEEWADRQGKLWVALDKEGTEYAIQKGVKFVRASKEEEARTAEKLKPVLGDYVKDKKAKGLPAEEALKFCLEYVKANP